jgi:hypothetical protein
MNYLYRTLGYYALLCCLTPDKDRNYFESWQVLPELGIIDYPNAMHSGVRRNRPLSFYIASFRDVYEPGMSMNRIAELSGMSRIYVRSLLKPIKKLRRWPERKTKEDTDIIAQN